MNNILKFKRVKSNAILPVRATSGSAGYDLFACMEKPIVIKSKEMRVISLGIASEVDSSNIAMFIYPRSGMSTKYGITLANCVGVIDSDYRGEWKVALINNSNIDFTVDNGMRIAQLVVQEVSLPEIVEVDNISETTRGSGGFGSTGTN